MAFAFRRRKKLTIRILVILIIIAAILSPIPAQAQENALNKISNHAVAIQAGCEYYFGASPFQEQVPPKWTAFKIPGQPENKNHGKDIWFRIQLPSGSWKEPSLFLRTYEQDLEVYWGGKIIFSYGDIKSPDKLKRPGSPLCIIPLPAGYANQPVYLHMHGIFAKNTGLILSLSIGSRSDHLLAIAKKDLDKIIFAFLFIFIGLVTIFLSMLRKLNQRAFFSLGFASVILALWIIAQTDIKLLFYNQPKIWFYVVHISDYLIPVGFMGYVEHIFATGRWKRFLRWAWRFQVLFTVLTFIADISGMSIIIRFIPLYFSFLILYIFLCLAAVIRAAHKGSMESRIFFCGICLLSIFGVIDFLGVYFMVLPWSGSYIHWGMFLFILSLVLILGKRFVDTYHTLAQWNARLEDAVSRKTSEIKSILDNAGQGFMTFGGDLRIDDAYSAECEKLFPGQIKGKMFSELIYPPGDERKYLELMLVRILHEKNESRKSLYFPLLPDEIYLDGKFVQVNYKLIDTGGPAGDKKFMAIFTDITDKKSLESKMENERIRLKMVVKAVTNHNDFVRFIHDYENFCMHKIPDILESDTPLQDKVFEIFRSVHTFKGSLSQMDMVHVVKKLHDFESRLSELNLHLGDLTLEDFRVVVEESGLCGWLAEDLNILKEVLGEEFLRHEKALMVDQTKLVAIEERLKAILPAARLETILPRIRELRYRPFHELLKSYPAFVARLAERLEKPMNPVEITGQDILVDTEKYHDFSVSLVHVFRNAMDHGIESAEERQKLGKPEFGTIRCLIRQEGNAVHLTIRDDGRGIDIQAIQARAVEKGLISQAEALEMSAEDALSLIFQDNVSVLADVQGLSGRGVGLAAVKLELEKLGGSVVVETTQGVGTAFHFSIPL